MLLKHVHVDLFYLEALLDYSFAHTSFAQSTIVLSISFASRLISSSMILSTALQKQR